MIILIFSLLLLFQLKHFVADFPLQGKYMLGKFKPGWDFVLPLSAHVAIHGHLTFVACLLFTHDALFSFSMMCFDMVTHFTMDRIKAGPKYLGRFNDVYDKKFWWAFGLDQMIHHLTHYIIIYFIIKRIQL